MKSAVYSSSSA
ncbi:hypothetical protein D034_4856A, partial [Vibrio parahaemolyticus Peru-288]